MEKYFINVDEVQLTAIAYYPFNGNADDETGNGYDGEVFGPQLVSDRNGNQKSAYSFNGDGYIALDMHYGTKAGAVSDAIDELTICVWIKSTSEANNMRILSFDYSYFDLSFQFGKVNWLTTTSSGDTKRMVTDKTYNDDSWHFICATVNSMGIRKFI